MRIHYCNCFFGIIFLAWIMGSCRKDTDTQAVYRIDPALQPYLDAFVAEGKQRGVELTLTNLIMEFGTTTDEGICGSCRQNIDNPNVQRLITIDRTEICWENTTEQAREALVFHELGHCLLKRVEHKNTLLPNGDFASLMNGQGELSVYAVCSYDIGGDNGDECNKTYRRGYYIDELFNANTPIPDWGK